MAMLQIYFCGSIRAGRADVGLYGRLIAKLKVFGEVLTEFVGDPSISDQGEEHQGGERGIHDRDVELLEKADVIVAEVTQASLGVGYEIGRAFAMGKRILCLYRPQEGKLLSGMISGLPTEKASVIHYKEEDIDKIFDTFFK